MTYDIPTNLREHLVNFINEATHADVTICRYCGRIVNREIIYYPRQPSCGICQHEDTDQ